MHIDIIDSLEDFATVRANWDKVYDADPEAHHFLSWQWLSDWLGYDPTGWFILAAKRRAGDGDHVAFLPMRIMAKFDRRRGLFNQVFLAGGAYADFAGPLAMPEHEAGAIKAFADHLKKHVHWAEFAMDNLLLSERRHRLWFAQFDRKRFQHRQADNIDDQDPNLNHSICPWIELAESWDGYLATLSSNNRQKIRRLLRKVDSSDQCRITALPTEELERGIEILLGLWRTKWAVRKADRIDGLVRRHRIMLGAAARSGSLFLPIFWHGDRPVGALAMLTDQRKRAMHFFLAARDESYEEMPTGYLLHASSIRHAIAQGFRSYEFLRGNEPYKYLFAQRERRVRPSMVSVRSGGNLGDRLDPRCIGRMVRMMIERDDRGQSADAERGYRQIIESEPDHALVLYRLGCLRALKGDHVQAAHMLRRSVEAEPKGDNAWIWLARSLQALGDRAAALEAWGEVARLQPHNEEARRMIVQLRFSAAPDWRPGGEPTPAVATILGGAVLAPAGVGADPGQMLQQWLFKAPPGLEKRH